MGSQKGESVYELLCIDIKTLDHGGFQSCKNGLIKKVLEDTLMENFNGLTTITKVKAHLGTDRNVSEANIYWTNPYDSVIEKILYLALKTRPDISFVVKQCALFKHNTRESHYPALKRMCRYLQGTKDKGLVFDPSKKLAVEYYSDGDCAVLQGHENPQYPILDRIRTVLVVNFANCHILWVCKKYRQIFLSIFYIMIM